MEPDTSGTRVPLACEVCRKRKRKCDGMKPRCSWCLTKNTECEYVVERPKKRKHDPDYVVGLETQIELLKDEISRLRGVSYDAEILSSTSDVNENRIEAPTPPSQPEQILPQDLSPAVNDVSKLMWQLSIGDKGETTLVGPSGNFCFPVPRHKTERRHHETTIPSDDMTQSQQLWDSPHATTGSIGDLFDKFTRLINPVQQFINADRIAALSKETSPPLDFLKGAIVAAGGLMSDDPKSRAFGNDMASRIEAEALTTCRRHPCVEVLQGLAIMCWREIGLDNENMAWMYNCMAASLALHLGLTVSSLESLREPSTGGRHTPTSSEFTSNRVRALWATVLLDRVATSLLGRNCMLPWRRVRAPGFLEAAGPAPTIDEVVFDYHCRLWFIHDQHMDTIYSFGFEGLDGTKRLQILLDAREHLLSFYRSLDPRVRLYKDKSPPTAIFLHMSYNMSQMLIHRPFLKEPAQSKAHILSLRSIITAAAAMVRLVRACEKLQPLDKVPPFVVHSVHTAAITLLLTATSSHPTVRNQSISRFRVCLGALESMKARWPRATRAVSTLRQLAQRWGIALALPMQRSSTLNFKAAEEHSGESTPNAGESTGTTSVSENGPMPPQPGSSPANPGNASSIPSDEAVDWPYFAQDCPFDDQSNDATDLLNYDLPNLTMDLIGDLDSTIMGEDMQGIFGGLFMGS